MPVYPIALRKKSMLHRQGTKEYHQVLITNGEGKAVLIQRWGKRNTEGQMSVQTYDDAYQAVGMFDAKDRDKKRNGYEHDPARDTIVECKDEAEFRKKLGHIYLHKLGVANLEHIAPGADTSNVKDPEPPPQFDANGKVVRKGYQPKHTFTDFVEPAKPTVAEEVAQNENWGMW
jgi:predicted DNA-binding WGR domain protein